LEQGGNEIQLEIDIEGALEQLEESKSVSDSDSDSD
jgi:hypothetical protein